MIKQEIDADMLMKFAQQIIIPVIILCLLITACKSSDKNAEQLKIGENKDTTSTETINKFLFLTEWFGKTGVYSYSLSEKKRSPVWWHPRENVVMLIYKPDKMPAYFLTADKMGTKGNFPFFNRLKLFRISQDFSETKQIDNIGSGLQFTARWNDDENLEVIFTSVDKTAPSYINQYTKVFDFYGKLIDSEIETFDIEKSGFPQLLPQRNSTVSPSGKHGVVFIGDSVFLKIAGNDTARFIAVMKHSLNKVKWSEIEEYLFFSTLDLNNGTIKTKNPETSELFVYSIAEDSLIKVFGGAGVKNFFTSGDLLIFDDGFNKSSIINIYNLKQREIVDVVQTKEGCGLVFIPKF